MRRLIGLLRFIIPLIVLYTIGYYVAGFSGLTVPWIVLLAAIIFVVDWLARWAIGGRIHRLGRGLINFLISTVVIFTVTLAIQGGGVPFGGALLAAAIIAILTALVDYRPNRVIGT